MLEEQLMGVIMPYEQVNKVCCCFNMRKGMRAVTQFFDRYLEPTGIRATQFTLLVELSSTHGKTLTDIAEGLVMDRTTLTRNLKPLEKMELITTIQPADKRAKAYVLTEKGKELLERCMPLWQQAQDNVVNGLGDETYQDLLGKLTRMLSVTSQAKKK